MSLREWRKYQNLARDIVIKISREIIKFAIENFVDVIVFEFLDVTGKYQMSNERHLHRFRKNDIQKQVEHMAHGNGMRLSTVCGWNVCSLAFDGSGEIKNVILTTNGKKGIAVFQTGKQYNYGFKFTV